MPKPHLATAPGCTVDFERPSGHHPRKVFLKGLAGERWRSLGVFLVLLLSIFLSGCVTPNRFTAVLTIYKNGEYCFTYTGTYYDLDIVMTLDANSANSAISDEIHDQKVQRALEVLVANPNLMSFEYIGEGLFNVGYQIRGNFKEKPLKLPNEMEVLFTLEQLPDRKTARFTFSPINESMPRTRELSTRLAQKMDGSIVIYSELPVIRTEGKTDKPTQASSVIWHVKGWSGKAKAPLMTISCE